MDEEPSRPASSKPFPGVIAAGALPTEDGEEPKMSGADFYIKKLQMMDAAGDPMLGKSFTLDTNADDQDAMSQITNMTTEQKIRDRNPKNKSTGLKEVLLLNLTEYGQEKFMADCWPGVSEALMSPMPALQEASLEVLDKVLGNPGTLVWLELRDLLKLLVEKTIPNLKPNFKKIFLQSVIKCFKKLGKDAFFDSLKENLGNKNPKIKSGLIRMLTDLLQHIGLKEFPALKYWEVLAKDIDSITAPAVKKEFVSYSVEVHRWFGDSFNAKLSVLKKFTMEEIQKNYEESKRADQALAEKDGNAVVGPMPILEEYQAPYKQIKAGGPAASQGANDSYDNFDPVDVYKSFTEKWTEKVLEKEKWIEKRDMVQEFLNTAMANPRHTGTYFPCIQLAKRLLEDSNLVVQTQAVRMLGAMAKGLRKEMAKDSRKVVNLLLPKLKERKKSFTDEVVESLRATLFFTMPQDAQSDYEDLLAIKNNTLLKQNILEWFVNVAESQPTNRLAGFVTAFKSSMIKMMEEGAKEIRDLNLALIAKLLEKFGTEPYKDLSDIVDKLPKPQADKLRNGLVPAADGRAESRGLAGSASKMRDLSRGSLGSSGGKQTSASPNRSSSLLTQSKVSQKPFGSSKPMIGAPLKTFRKPGDQQKDMTAASVTGQNVGAGFGEVRIGDTKPENALVTLAGRGVTTEAFNSAMNAHWKQKQEFLETLREIFCKVEVSPKPTQEEYTAVGILLINLLKLFKESNPLLLKDYQSLVTDIVGTASAHDQDCLGGKFIYSIGWYLIEKYADAKLIDKQKELITSLTEKNTGYLMLSLCELISSKTPAVKTYQSVLQLLGELAEKHPKVIPKREIVSLAREASCHANTGVRDEAITLFCTLAKFISDSIKKAVQELKNPQIKKMIETKLEKVQPVMMDIEETPQQDASSRADIPKRDISSQISKMMPQFRDSKWLTRRDSLVEATRIIRNSVKIMSKGLTDFGTVIKERLADSNTSVAKEALTLLMSYSKALGSDFRGQAKLLLPLAVPFLTDKLDVIRDTAKSAFEFSIQGAGADITLPVLLRALSDPNPEVVIRVFDFLARESIHRELRKTDQKMVAKAIVTNLIHKSQQVRAASERLLELVCSAVPREAWVDAQRDLNPSTRLMTEATIGKYLPELSSISHSQIPTKMDIETPLGETLHQSFLTMDRQLRKVKTNTESMMFGHESVASVSRGSTPGSKMSLNLPSELQLHNMSRMVMSQFPLQTSQSQGILHHHQRLARSTSLQEGLVSLHGSGDKRNDSMGSRFNQPFSGSLASQQNQEMDILLTWSEPRDDEIAQVKESLTSVFGEQNMEKMMSNEQPKLIESLTVITDFRSRYPDQYRSTINLIFNWMYLRVFDTTRKMILEFLGDFLVNCLEDIVNRRINLTPDSYSRLYRVFERVLINHPNKEDCLGYVQKCGSFLGRSMFSLEFFGFLIEQLTPSSTSDTNLVASLLTIMSSSIDITKALSLRSVSILEDFTTQLQELKDHELFNFYSAAHKTYGLKFFDVFRFRQQEKLQKYFGGQKFEITQPLPDTIRDATQALDNPSIPRAQRIPSLRSLASVADSVQMNPILASQLESTWSAITRSLICSINEFSQIVGEITATDEAWYAETTQLLIKFCSPYLNFLGCLSIEEVSGILNSLLEALLHFHRLGQGSSAWGKPTVFGVHPEKYKQLGTRIHDPILQFSKNLAFEVSLSVLLSMLEQIQQSQRPEAGEADAELKEYNKRKSTVIWNCLGLLNKNLPNILKAPGVPRVNVEACLSVIEKYFQNYREEKNSNQTCKILRGTILAFCDHFKERILDYLSPSGAMVIENSFVNIRPLVTQYLNDQNAAGNMETSCIGSTGNLRQTASNLLPSLQNSAAKKSTFNVLAANQQTSSLSPRVNLLPSLLLNRIKTSAVGEIFTILNGERKRVCADTLNSLVEMLQQEGEVEKARRVKEWDDEEKENRERLDNERSGVDQVNKTAEKHGGSAIYAPSLNNNMMQSALSRGGDYSHQKIPQHDSASSMRVGFPFNPNQTS